MEIPYRFELLTPLYLLSIFTNSFLVFAIWRQKKLSVTSFRFVACLSVSDVLLSVFGLAIAVIVITKKPIDKQMYDALVVLDMFNSFFTNFSSAMILIISVDRFIHMKYLLRYREVMTKRREVGLIVVNALITLHGIVIMKVLPAYKRELVNVNLRAYIGYLAAINIIYFLIVCSAFIGYIATYLSIKRRIVNQTGNASSSIALETRSSEGPSLQGRTTGSSQCSSVRRKRAGKRRSERQFAKGVVLVLGAMLVFYLPNITAAIFSNIAFLSNDRALLLKSYPYVSLIRHISYAGIVLNCSINAVLLIVFSTDLKRYTKRTFCCNRRVDT